MIPIFSSSECIEKPLDVVRYLLELESNSSDQLALGQATIPEYFKTIFELGGKVNQIPSLNDVSCVYDIPQYTLVRFRAMIQNTGFGHEVFVSSYEMVNNDGIKQRKFHKYSDEIILKDENLNDVLESLNSPTNEFSERQLFYCTSVPGETQSRLKSVTDIEGLHPNNLNKKHMAAVVKIYEKEDSFKVTDVVEFIGVLNYPRKATNDANESQCEEFNVLYENTASCYTPSVHVIFYRKLHPTGNPLIPTTNLS
ncbi:12722_t:CDS:2, partial [Funneliformis mosseae]